MRDFSFEIYKSLVKAPEKKEEEKKEKDKDKEKEKDSKDKEKEKDKDKEKEKKTDEKTNKVRQSICFTLLYFNCY